MKKWLSRVLVNFIAHFIPKRGKRIIYIVVCYLIWSQNQDKQTIRHELIEINNKLNIAADEHAINFVVELRDLLLEIDEFKALKSQPQSKINTYAVNLMPSWVTYGDKAEVTRDLSEVFTSRYSHA